MTYGDKLAAAGIATGILARQELEKVLKAKVFLPKGSKILDIGCHGGNLSIFLANLFSAEVTGIDSSISAIQLAEKKVSETFTEGKILLENVRFEDFNSNLKFDLVAHRGMEVFFQSPAQLASLISNNLKNYGYVVNVTHLYNEEPSEDFLKKLNSLLGMSISYISKDELIRQYESANLRFVYHEEVNIVRSTSNDVDEFLKNLKLNQKQQSELLENINAISKNEDLVTANIFIFRKKDVSSEKSIEHDKA